MMRGRLMPKLTIIIVTWATNAGRRALIVSLLPVYMAYTEYQYYQINEALGEVALHSFSLGAYFLA